jgi:non-specific serine/threonine protein kinase
VLGIDIEALGAAVARHWGLGEEMLHMIRRLPKDLPVRMPDNDSDVLRITASAANEAVDASLMPAAAPRSSAATAGVAADGSAMPSSAAKGSRGAGPRTSVAQRYARSLGLTPRIVQESLAAARQALRTGEPVQTSASRGEDAPAAEQAAVAAN